MGLAKDLGHLNDDVTIFKEEVVGENDFGEIKKWVGTVSKGLYRDITKVSFGDTKENVEATGYFIIQEDLELRDGSEERVCLGSYAGEYETLPEFSREILSKKDRRRNFEIKQGLPPTEWKVYVK